MNVNENVTVTIAQRTRRQHIDHIKADIVRLSNAVAAFEKHTVELPEWDYVSDWHALASDVMEATDRAEEMARQTNKWWKVVNQ